MNALVTRLSSLVTAIAALSAAHAAEMPQLAWRLPPCAHFEGDILMVDVPAGDPETGVEAHAHCEADIDLSPYLEGGRGAVMRIRVRARDVSKPDFNWNGVKCMFRYVSDVDGNKVWPGFQFPLGTFDWCAAEAVREIDPVTPIVFAANLASKAPAFRYLRPIAMDNVIYQAHVYLPNGFTHQGVGGNSYSTPERPLSWPGRDPITGEAWNKEWLRKTLQPVRDFQLRHHARIFVGEFSAAAWAPGAENYLRDAISLFEEYGWDWTYHAFRESPVWDVEKVAPPGVARPSSKDMIDATGDTPRKRALLDGFAGKILP